MTPARVRIPTYAVWETVVFALNILAFIFIGLQIRPIIESLAAADRARYFTVAGAVLVMVIVVRLAWHMSFNAVIRWRNTAARVSIRRGRCCDHPRQRPGDFVVRYARYSVSGCCDGAAGAFPYRDLIVLTAFAVVLGHVDDPRTDAETALARARPADDDPVGHEVNTARERALRAGLASFENDRSPVAELVRREFKARLANEAPDQAQQRAPAPHIQN